MKFVQTDNITFQGYSHQICQDFSLSNNEKIPFIVVSDGCSSAQYSELGAQILCHITREVLNEYNLAIILDPNLFIEEILKRAKKAINIIGVKNHSLFATLLVAFVYINKVIVYAFGDGCISVVGVDNKIDIIQIDYLNNMPFYPIYNNPKDIDLYLNSLNNHRLPLDSKTVINWQKEGDKYIQVFKSNDKFDNITVREYNINSIKSISITTDGVGSFIKDSTQNKLLTEVVENCTFFKKYKKSFLQRMAQKYTEKLYTEEFQNYDDVSIATILITNKN